MNSSPIEYYSNESINRRNDLEQPIMNLNNINQNPNQIDNDIARSNSLAVRRNVGQELDYSIKNSIGINSAFAFMALGKIIASSVVLATSLYICNKIKVWLEMMIIHDLLVFLIQCIIIFKTLTSNPNDDQFINNDDSNNQISSPLPSSDRSERIERSRSKYISCLINLSRIFYLVLMIYAQILFYDFDPNCSQPSSARTLLLIYILMFYAYIGFPIIIVIVICICLPILILRIIFARPNQNPASQVDIDKLPIFKYENELPGSNTCSICMQDYVINEDIIQLRCSPMHHFHSNCLKTWLNLNGLCPICRTPINANNSR